MARAVVEAAREGVAVSQNDVPPCPFFFLMLGRSAQWERPRPSHEAGRMPIPSYRVGRLGYATAYPVHPVGPPVLQSLYIKISQNNL